MTTYLEAIAIQNGVGPILNLAVHAARLIDEVLVTIFWFICVLVQLQWQSYDEQPNTT
jgi:hypothetical protein